MGLTVDAQLVIKIRDQKCKVPHKPARSVQRWACLMDVQQPSASCCFCCVAGPVILPGSDAGNDTLIGINSYLLTNATGDVLCGDPSLGEVATSVGAYSAFLKATLREFEGLPKLLHLHESSIALCCEWLSIWNAARRPSKCTFSHIHGASASPALRCVVSG